MPTPFELDGREVADRGVTALGFVEVLDLVVDLEVRVTTVLKHDAIKELGFAYNMEEWKQAHEALLAERE